MSDVGLIVTHSRWKLFLLAIKRLRAGKAGDFALLKADMLGAKPCAAANEKLRHVIAYRPKVDLASLSQLPRGTFGQAYASWMIEKKLQPFEISEDLGLIASRNTFAVRYAITHDMFHVLTDFDTSYAGEIGVLSFAVAQGYSKQFEFGLKLASILYPILSFGKLKSIRAARQRGYALGQSAKFLLGERLEDYFEQDLNDVRDRLNIVV